MTLIPAFAMMLSALGPLAPAPATTPAAAQTAPAGAALTLSFTGLKTPSGRIMGVLFDSEAAYRTRGAPAHQVVVDVTGAEARATVSGLKPGRYAMQVFHDLDGDEKLSFNPFGMPAEPFAFSNNARGMMGPASWAEASFEVGTAGAQQTIAID